MDSHVKSAVQQMQQSIPVWVKFLGASQLEARFRETIQSSIDGLVEQVRPSQTRGSDEGLVGSPSCIRSKTTRRGLPMNAKPKLFFSLFESQTLTPFGNVYSETRRWGLLPFGEDKENLEESQETEWDTRIHFVPST